MKIFNWVQKRLHPNLLKDGVARKVKKTDSVAIHGNTKALMEQVAFVDVLDGWKYGGILTIGTFGFDPLTKLELDQEKDYSTSESDEEAEEGDGYGLNNDSVQHENDNNSSTDTENEEVDPLMFNICCEEAGGKTADIEIMSVDDFVVLGAVPPVASSTHAIKLDHLDDQGKLKRRTTLAELFSEDSDSAMKKKPSPKEFKRMSSGTKAFPKTKNGLSFAKKLIPHAGEDARPLKKIQKMMRRMLKKKIHPDAEGKGSASDSKPDCPNKPVVLNQASEFGSLLPTPDAAA
ncbi:hypothetical protein SLEP1_g2214 [Rubroshorea leprosula]|uniref:Protein TILLER ANGLE CONTROL 1 n=1 Tax=Rubroshorea leprosula TaxID=152421 RepID=A0AAV5HQJ2_9ROSI|nr:hypothetical protein SLEP1_g2214 [Rubroshorea leprosula]